MPDLSGIHVPDFVWRILQILLIIVVAGIVLRYARGLVHGVFAVVEGDDKVEADPHDLAAIDTRKRVNTLEGLAKGLVQTTVVAVAALMILDQLGIDIGPALAGLGIAGVAIGFGAQSLVKDYFNGVLILIENQFGRGDVVKIAGVEGTVEDISLRRTTLRDHDGNVHTVPNSAIIVATNLTRGWARVSEDLLVPSADLVDAAREIVDRVGEAMEADPVWRRRLLEAPHVESIGAIGPKGITLRITARVAAVHRWTVIGEIRRRLLAAFEERGMPFVPIAAVAVRESPAQGHEASPPPSTDGNVPLDTTPSAAAQAAAVEGAGGQTAAAGPSPDDLSQGTD